jgi:hypothetical protein
MNKVCAVLVVLCLSLPASANRWAMMVDDFGLPATSHQAATKAKFTNNFDPVRVSLHMGLGIHFRDPYISDQIGIRLELRHSPITLEVSSLSNGFGIDFLLYAFRSKWISFHMLDPGIGFNTFGRYVSTPYIQRSMDLRIGAGANGRIVDHVSWEVSWKVSIADPAMVIPSYGDYGRTVFIDAIKESSCVIGILVH